MSKTNLVVFITAIMIVGIVGTNVVPNAEALKGKGVETSQYGSSTDICGLVLCSDYPGGKETYQTNWFKIFLNSQVVSEETHSEDHDEHKVNEIVPSANNADEKFPAQLDEVIHKFELGKISAENAIDGIKAIHNVYVNAKIANDIIDGVGKKLSLHDSGSLNAADAVEAIHLTAEPQNVNPEYQGALDEVIHLFEKDKISADEAIEGIKEVHEGFVGLYITSELIESVGEKIVLIDSGELSGADAVESIHLSAEPQNVNPEFIGALDEYLHKFELNELSAADTMAEIIEVHSGLTSLYISSELVENVGNQINIYNSGNDSAEQVLHEIHEVIEETELAAAAAMSDRDIPVMKELPSNHVDIPSGSGVPGCEIDNWCYMSANLHVHVGDTVTWVNSDNLPHTVTSVNPTGAETPTPEDEDGLFDSGFISGGDEWSYTFDVEGEYYYYCQLHPWMQGEINVQ